MKKRTTRQWLLFISVALVGVTLIAVEAYLIIPPVRIRAVSVREAVGADGSLVGMFSDADPQVQLAASSALARRGPKAVPALRRGAEHPDPQVRTFSLITLGQIGPPARDAFATIQDRARNDPDPEVRRVAISAIASVGDGDTETISALVAVLESGDDGRLDAARTLGGNPKCKVAEAVPALTRRLKDSSAKVREQAAESLGAMAPVTAPAVRALIEALRDSQAEVRAEAAEALGQLAAFTRSAVPELIFALNDPDPKVRSEVAGTLERIAREWGEGEPALRQQAVDALRQVGRSPST